MESSINILHLTDSHIKEGNKEDIKRRIDALTTYLLEEKESVDLIAFTGDLTYHGTSAEYVLFDEYVAEPLKRRLRINDSRILLIPGNHDVLQTEIPLIEHKRLRKLSAPREAEQEHECPALTTTTVIGCNLVVSKV